ncbi:MAG TPA: CYTH domain-containing protein, partial [Rubrivivax sp.]|nr:CYTH domain-containing protein [Rubrivivax sp.]
METELKFQVPPARSAELRRAVATKTARTVRLQALYADTADQRLAAAGLALRLRKEGRVWVQTLKGRGDGLMQRLEHEVRLPPQRGEPVLDPLRHAGTPVGTLLLQTLEDAQATGAELRTLYRTDIRRLHRRVRHGGALIEIACDHGRIVADGRRVAVDEIEFELVSGPPAALPALAARWAARFGLWWDVRTKSERGYRLALGLDQVPATKASPAVLPAGAGLREAWCTVLQS